MGRFLAGFLLATVIWGGLFYGYATGVIQLNLGEPEPEVVDEQAPPADDGDAPRKKKRKWKRKKKGPRSGNALIGDRLGGPDTRNLNAAEGGGEEQLLGSEIEAGFDSVFPKVRRCLVLAADDAPVSGKLVFGLRISGAGKVTKVNLRGPSGITQSEAGGCLRNAARSIKFRNFNGPDMLVHFPLTLE